MSELLRMANELIEARARAVQGEWMRGVSGIHLSDVGIIYDENGGAHHRDEEFIVLAANNAVDIIKGYQDLVRRIVLAWDSSDTLSDLADNLIDIIEEAKTSIPELTNE